jgi:hypothetical protein
MDQQSVEGMTVNERLAHFGLFEPFDTAARSRDLTALVQVLLRARFSQEQAKQTAVALLADPARYGF